MNKVYAYYKSAVISQSRKIICGAAFRGAKNPPPKRGTWLFRFLD